MHPERFEAQSQLDGEDSAAGVAPLHMYSHLILEMEVKLLREMLDTMRDDRDAWREQAAKMTAALSLPAPAPATEPEPPRSWGVD
jgi:hypothetical protein